MDDAPFRRVHGRHFHGPPFADGTAGRSVGHALDRLDAALAVAFGIEHDPLEVGALPEGGHVDQILKGIDSLALLPYEQRCVIRGDVCGDEAACIVDLDTGFEAHGIQNRRDEGPDLLQQLFGCHDLFRLGLFTVDLGQGGGPVVFRRRRLGLVDHPLYSCSFRRIVFIVRSDVRVDLPCASSS